MVFYPQPMWALIQMCLLNQLIVWFRDPPIKVRGPAQHMVETVDHILFIVIFTFMSHVSKTLFYTLKLSLYIFLLLTLFISLSNWY